MNASASRRGFVLPTVLIVLVLLTGMVYQFNEAMLNAAQRAAHNAEAARAEEAAFSGFPFAAARLHAARARTAQEKEVAITLSTAFQELPTPGDPRCGFRLIGREADSRFPDVVDESAKLNLNSLPLTAHEAPRARNMLLALPRMTPQLADAVLDWIDSDDQPRQFGAERSYYFSAATTLPRNGRLDSLKELLLVRGVTADLLFGDSASRHDSARGWSEFLTVSSRESNRRDDGTAKIYLNQDDCVALYDELVKQFDERTSLFLAALRRYGPMDDTTVEELTEEQKRRAAQLRAARQRGQLVDDDSAADRGPSRMRAGLELNGRAGYVIRSWADVCGVRVRVRINDGDEVLISPWPADREGLRRAHLELTPHVTPFAGVAVEGRINVAVASVPVLMTLSGMTPETARAIAAAGEQVRDEGRQVCDPAWLLDRGFADWKTLQGWLPLMTVRGDLVVLRSEGTAGGGRIRRRLTARIDIASQDWEILDRRITIDPAATK